MKGIENVSPFEVDQQANKIIDVDALGDSEAYDFLISSARNREFELSQNDVNLLVEKSIKHIQSGNFGFSEAINFVQAISHDSWKWEEGREFLVEKVFRSLPEQYKSHPEIVHELESIIGQEYYIRPEVFLDVASNAFTDPDIDTYLRSDLVHSFNYQYSFAGDGYDRAIKGSLDFENPQSYRQAGETLNFLRNLSVVSGDNGFSEDLQERLKKILKDKNEDQKGSFLLNLRAQFLYKDLCDGHPERRGIDELSRLPYKISKDNYGYIENGIVYIIKSGASDSEVDDLMHTINSELLYARPEKGKRKSDIIDKYIEKIKEIKENAVPIREIGQLSKKTKVEIMDYEYLVYPSNQILFKSMLGVDVEQLSFEEQFELLHYLKGKTFNEVKQFQDFSKKYSTAGLRTFLSLEYGRDFGDKIIEIGEKLSEEDAKMLFAKYSEIVDSADKAVLELSTASTDESKSKGEIVEKVRDNLLRYGRKLLENFGNKLDGDNSKKDIEQLMTQLTQTKGDIVLSAVVFKALANEGVAIEEIANMNIETQVRENLKLEDKDEMKRIFHENRGEYPEDLRAVTEKEFDVVLETGKREFHILRRGEDIIAFARFDELPNGNLYIGSLNVRPEIKSLTVGGTFLADLIRQKNKDYTLEAEAYSKNKMLKNYTDKFGFEIVEDIPSYKGSEHLFYKMEIPKGKMA